MAIRSPGSPARAADASASRSRRAPTVPCAPTSMGLALQRAPSSVELRPRGRTQNAVGEVRAYAVHGALSYEGLKFILRARFAAARPGLDALTAQPASLVHHAGAARWGGPANGAGGRAPRQPANDHALCPRYGQPGQQRRRLRQLVTLRTHHCCTLFAGAQGAVPKDGLASITACCGPPAIR